ncbi:MAG: hemerythrin domain-containing protein [Desulforhabdus sp.]|jgi:hemerythrin-like domain-containing protein|nr:hemerythrin domain-containing protein [Desulforhabdus sp.]
MHQEFFKVLKKDHQEVKSILEQLKETSKTATKAREKLFSQLKEEIKPHMTGEEKAFYPALKKYEEAKDNVLESIEEHHVTESVLKELDKMSKSEENWGAKLSVFKELVEHHIEEEEEKIFSDAEENLDAEKMKQIMEDFNKEKEKAKKAL